ncbi:unnamed protein product, partial [Arabidopsis halleri]
RYYRYWLRVQGNMEVWATQPMMLVQFLLSQVFVYTLAEKLLGLVLVTRFVGALLSPIQMTYPFITNLSALPISSLYPFLYYMDFGVAKTERDIGFYTGFVACSFMLGRALTSVSWGIVSDRYGRKPIIIVGTVSM